MQNNLQHGGGLAQLLSGQPLAIDAAYWHSSLYEAETLQRTITAEEIGRLRGVQSARIIDPNTGETINEATNLSRTANVPKGSIAYLHLTGVMISQDFLWFRGVNHLAAELIAANANPNIGGIVLEVNSGGGEVRAGQMLLAAMTGLSTPVAVFAHYMASAAVMATLPALHIIASSPGAEIGSIGTYGQYHLNTVKYQREAYKTIYAKRSTLKNKIWRAILGNDYSLAEQHINIINDRFIADVKRHRRVDSDVFTGDIYAAQTALSKGLIDQVGTFPDALHWASMKSRMKLEKPKPKKEVTPPKARPAKSKAQLEIMAAVVEGMKAAKGETATEIDQTPSYLKNPINQRASRSSGTQKNHQ